MVWYGSVQYRYSLIYLQSLFLANCTQGLVRNLTPALALACTHIYIHKAGLYVVQNNLLFIAVENLDAPKYQARAHSPYPVTAIHVHVHVVIAMFVYRTLVQDYTLRWHTAVIVCQYM